MFKWCFEIQNWTNREVIHKNSISKKSLIITAHGMSLKHRYFKNVQQREKMEFFVAIVTWYIEEFKYSIDA